MNGWLLLMYAGLFEIGFTTFMKLSNGFTQIKYIIPFIICAALSFYCLNKASIVIPLGTAYAIWTGIGAFGTALIGMIYFQDPVSITRIAFLSFIIISVLGLKLTASS